MAAASSIDIAQRDLLSPSTTDVRRSDKRADTRKKNVISPSFLNNSPMRRGHSDRMEKTTAATGMTCDG